MRGKHERKKQRNSTPPQLNASVVTKVDQEMSAKSDKAKERQEKQGEPVSFIKLWKEDPKFRVEVIAVGGGLCVLIVYIFQLCAMLTSNQLNRIATENSTKQFRIDQRPLLKIEIVSAAGFKEGTKVMGDVKVSNVGKTPARDIVVNITAEKVIASHEPTLSPTAPHITAKGGTLFPNLAFPDLIPYGMTIETPDGRPDFTPISRDDDRAYTKGDIYYAVYAWATYSDFSGVSHWTHFCTFAVLGTPNPDHAFYAGKCTAYNDIDTN
jgi:hypothetical protein